MGLEVILFIASAVFFYLAVDVGLMGLQGEAAERRSGEGSAIRHIVYAVQQGTGLVVAALSFILAAVTGLLMKLDR